MFYSLLGFIMKKLFGFLLMIFTISLFSCNKADEKTEPSNTISQEILVKNCYKAYQSALLSGDGKTSLKLINQAGIDYYDAIFKYVLEADSETVATMPLMDKLMILSLRFRTDRNTLLRMEKNGESIYEYGVNQGLVGANSVRQAELGTIMISDNEATARVLQNGQEIPMQFKFVKEDNKWKFDAKYMLVQTGFALQQYLVEKGVSEDDFIQETLEKMSSKPVDDEIWHPIK